MIDWIVSSFSAVVEAPTVRFAQVHCLVREASGRYQFEVIREGADLSQPSSVICSTEAMSPVSATPNEDYVHMSDRVNFAPGQRRAVCSVQIIDDSYYEGNESFHLVLSQPTGATVGHPGRSTVTIFDTDSEGLSGQNNFRIMFSFVTFKTNATQFCKILKILDRISFLIFFECVFWFF